MKYTIKYKKYQLDFQECRTASCEMRFRPASWSRKSNMNLTQSGIAMVGAEDRTRRVSAVTSGASPIAPTPPSARSLGGCIASPSGSLTLNRTCISSSRGTSTAFYTSDEQACFINI